MNPNSLRVACLSLGSRPIAIDRFAVFGALSESLASLSALIEHGARAKCGKCGGRRMNVRQNWKEKPGQTDDWEARPAWEE